MVIPEPQTAGPAGPALPVATLAAAPPRQSHLGAVVEQILAAIRHSLPEGTALPDDVWQRPHRVILWLLWLHAVGIVLFGLLAGFGLPHSLVEGTPVAIAAL